MPPLAQQPLLDTLNFSWSVRRSASRLGQACSCCCCAQQQHSCREAQLQGTQCSHRCLPVCRGGGASREPQQCWPQLLTTESMTQIRSLRPEGSLPGATAETIGTRKCAGPATGYTPRIREPAPFNGLPGTSCKRECEQAPGCADSCRSRQRLPEAAFHTFSRNAVKSRLLLILQPNRNDCLATRQCLKPTCKVSGTTQLHTCALRTKFRPC